MNITNFKSSFNGGTRANRFVVNGKIRGDTEFNGDIAFHVRSTFIPPITNITLTHNAFGRKLNIPGDREYSPWQITVYDDLETSTGQNRDFWKKFHSWSDRINEHHTNDTAINAPYLDYKADWNVTQLDLNGVALKRFQLLGCWPKSVSDIDFNMTRRNFLNTFSVIMLYDEIRLSTTQGGNVDPDA